MSGAPSRLARIILIAIILFFSHTFTVWAGGQSDRKKGAAAPAAPATPAVPAAAPGEDIIEEENEGSATEEGEADADGAAELPAEIPSEEAEAGPSPEESVIDMDIKTSTLTELASWCRSLGLSEGGTREELAQRLRDHFHVTAQSAAGKEESGKKVITIESARSTEYFTLDVVDEEYARLRGDVIVSLKDGEALHRITAREILYNRTRNLLTAIGGVKYVKEEGEIIETFSGDNITVNLDNWSSIFMDGVSEKSLQNEETTYRFAGTVISRTDEDVTVLTNAEISNAANPEALWSLKAGKLWLLPGADFAIFNAFLKVGEIPVLYIPFFYWPADEVIFHPVLGMRSREGAFVQTTTYILGRPKAAATSENSLTKMMGGGPDMERVQEGLFLRSTGKKVQNSDEISLKAMIDYYTNLGAYLGTDLILPKKGILNSLDLSLGIGFTRDVVMLPNGNYTPFARYDGTSDWNKSRLFSLEIPFRYRLKTSGSLGGKYGSLSWDIPFYSDPYVNSDFLNRSETMDWVRLMQDGSAAFEDNETSTIESSYQWRLNGSVTPSLPAVIQPYISTLSLSSITSTMEFRSRELAVSHPEYNAYSPSRTFFYPDKITLYSMTLSIAGTPLTLGAGTTQAAQVKDPSPEDDPFKNIGVPRSPWGPAVEGAKVTEDSVNLVPPALAQRFEIRRPGGPKFSIDYRLTPTAASELQFRNNFNHWQKAEDIDWEEVSSVLTNIRGDASTSFSLNDPNGLYSSSFQLNGTGFWKDYSYVNEEAEEVIAAGTEQAFRNSGANKDRFFSTSYNFSTTVKPLYFSSVWGNSSIQYELKGLLAQSVFKNGNGKPGSPTLQDEPEWEVKYGHFDKDSEDKDYLNSHAVITNIAADVLGKAQTFKFTADLPPRKEVKLKWDATLRAWIAQVTVGTGIAFPDKDEDKTASRIMEEEKKDYKLDPLDVTGTFTFWKYGDLKQTMKFDMEKNNFTSLTTSLNIWGFMAYFQASYSKPWEFKYTPGATSGNGWFQTAEETFHPDSFAFGYARIFKKENLWKNRLSFSVNVDTKMTFNLQQYTASDFYFNLGFTLGITKFIDISFSTKSTNKVIYRYFKDMPGFQIPLPLPEGDQNNFFLDLFNSFRFDDEALRRSSGFKLSEFQLDVTHHLGDWNAKLGMILKPYRDETGPIPKYKFNTELSFLVQWIPISEIKTDMKLDKEVWTVK
ncbi:hypothetical protein FACS1894110_18270 [Spirochaetia bacterium]|nr:hypothetical protein FACS1894110_18270 [Spirochaetia bacterium]